MRIVLIGHDKRIVPGDYQAPPGKEFLSELLATRFHPHPVAPDLFALKVLGGGAGIWRSNGELVYHFPAGADLGWLANGNELLCLEATFEGDPSGYPGVPHRLTRLTVPTFRKKASLSIAVPTGGVEYLCISPSGKRCIATWLDQSECGYVGVDLDSFCQTDLRCAWTDVTLSAPAFHNDDTHVVSCVSSSFPWWVDEFDDIQTSPSPGGTRMVGLVAVQSWDAPEQISQHPIIVELPPGWQPARPSYSEWRRIWGPEMLPSGDFRVWLPDDSGDLYTLPLPDEIRIKRQIGVERRDLDV